MDCQRYHGAVVIGVAAAACSGTQELSQIRSDISCRTSVISVQAFRLLWTAFPSVRDSLVRYIFWFLTLSKRVDCLHC